MGSVNAFRRHFSKVAGKQDRSPGNSAREGAKNKSPGVTAEREAAHVVIMGPGENNHTSRKGKKQ